MGVVRKEDGSLHFFVNGVAQGPAAWNVPPSVYAVVDLYGQAAQATIMDDMGERGSQRKRKREREKINMDTFTSNTAGRKKTTQVTLHQHLLALNIEMRY